VNQGANILKGRTKTTSKTIGKAKNLTDNRGILTRNTGQKIEEGKKIELFLHIYIG